MLELLELLAQSSTEDPGAVGTVVSLVIFIAIPVLFGAWTANAAERKGYGRALGWVLGIFLGLLGRIIVGVMKDQTVIHRDREGRPLP